MDNTFRIEIYTPEKLFLSDEITALTVLGLDGEYGIMKDHVPTVVALREGYMYITSKGVRRKYISGTGYLEMNDNLAMIFVSSCEKDGKAE
ncbi:MAG: F0F1 ATP synthase subunit epsilon [Clostridia bacterium]|nr:F0F1 ATP synthase subunit epsilon [Clostridia bacterium]